MNISDNICDWDYEFTEDKVVPVAAAGAIAVVQYVYVYVCAFLKESSEDHFQVCEAQIIIAKDNVKTLCCSS